MTAERVMAIGAQRGGQWGILLIGPDGAEWFLSWSEARALVVDMDKACRVIEGTHPAVVSQ